MQAININTKPDKTAESHLNPVTEFGVNTMQNGTVFVQKHYFSRSYKCILKFEVNLW
jgi:histone acetyltransferase (RNA polymerase elongator complex component)